MNSRRPLITILFCLIVLALCVLSSAATRSFLEDEAGIAAYVNMGRPLDLRDVAFILDSVELQTPDFIIGEVAVNALSGMLNPHIFATKEGWLVAYYPQFVPTSSIINWRRGSGTFYRSGVDASLNVNVSQWQVTTLQSAIALFTNWVIPPIAYYDFRYPSAACILVINEHAGPSNPGTTSRSSFLVEIPDGLLVWEASSSVYGFTDHGNDARYGFYFDVNGTRLVSHGFGSSFTLSASPEKMHTVHLASLASYLVIGVPNVLELSYTASAGSVGLAVTLVYEIREGASRFERPIVTDALSTNLLMLVAPPEELLNASAR